jgi:hypothetical protein
MERSGGEVAEFGVILTRNHFKSATTAPNSPMVSKRHLY